MTCGEDKTRYCPVCNEYVAVNSNGAVMCDYIDCPNDTEQDADSYAELDFNR